MRLSHIFYVIIILTLSIFCFPAHGRDVARDLKRMKGFTISDTASVKEVVKGDVVGKKIVVLDNGTKFEVNFLLLDPLPLTDVIIFTKPFSKELREKYKDLPDNFLYEYKLLIDSEVFDAFLVR
jgi:hypothetical protein